MKKTFSLKEALKINVQKMMKFINKRKKASEFRIENQVYVLGAARVGRTEFSSSGVETISAAKNGTTKERKKNRKIKFISFSRGLMQNGQR